jgi:hypothetical protein
MIFFLTILFWTCISLGLGVAWLMVCIARDWASDIERDPTLRALAREDD